MMRTSRRSASPMRRPWTIALGLAAASVVVAACGSGSHSGNPPNGQNGATQNGGGAVAGQTVPTAGLPVLQKVGKGEGQLNLIAWEGYLEPKWVKPFEQQTGCQVNAQVRGHVGRDGRADEERRRRPVRHGVLLRRRRPARSCTRGDAHPVERRS